MVAVALGQTQVIKDQGLSDALGDPFIRRFAWHKTESPWRRGEADIIPTLT